MRTPSLNKGPTSFIDSKFSRKRTARIKGGNIMQQFGRIFFRGLLGLTASTVMTVALQAQAAPTFAPVRSQSDPAALGPATIPRYLPQRATGPEAEALNPEAFLLSQGSGPLKEKQVSSPPGPAKTKGQKQSGESGEQKEQIKKKSGKGAGGGGFRGGGGGSRSGAGHKSRSPQEPGAAGTKKLGGQIVRDKEGPPEK
jgi:hypothetical protein